jgi:putative transcriptional regulator
MKKVSVEEMLIDGLRSALKFEKGEQRLKTSKRELPDPAPVFRSKDVQRLRKDIFKMTQIEFAIVLNISPSTLRSWEQGTRKPTDSALRLLQLLTIDPSVLKTLKAG